MAKVNGWARWAGVVVAILALGLTAALASWTGAKGYTDRAVKAHDAKAGHDVSYGLIQDVSRKLERVSQQQAVNTAILKRIETKVDQ